MRTTDSLIIKGVHDYVVLLKRNHPFNCDDQVTIVASDDYIVMKGIFNELKEENEYLTKEMKKKDEYIVSLEKTLSELIKDK